MKKNRTNLQQLKVKSFVVTPATANTHAIKGGRYTGMEGCETACICHPV